MELLDRLVELNSSDMYPLHMPGHKRNLKSGGLKEVYSIDITEIDDFDDLHDPSGMLLDIAKRYAKVYGAGYAYMSVNGSTAANEAAISACVGSDDEIIISRYSHKSIYFGIEQSGAKPIYVIPRRIQGTSMYAPVTEDQIREKLQNNPDCKTVMITSPTYEGYVADIEAIADVTHEYGATLIVDSAHGAHLGFNDRLPANPIALGADIVIMSLHKMMTSPTQTALLLVSEAAITSNRVKLNLLQHYMKVYQSSSPSYVLMAGMGETLDYLERNAKEDIVEMLEYIAKLHDGLSKLQNMTVEVPTGTDFEYDPCKLIIRSLSGGANGRYIYDRLREDYCLQCEMCGEEYALALLTVMDTPDAYERIVHALCDLDQRLDNKGKKDYTAEYSFAEESVAVMAIAEALRAESYITESLEEAVDHVSSEYVSIYPPGIPLLIPGEIICQSVIEYIKYGLDNGLNVQGLCGSGMRVVK